SEDGLGGGGAEATGAAGGGAASISAGSGSTASGSAAGASSAGFAGPPARTRARMSLTLGRSAMGRSVPSLSARRRLDGAAPPEAASRNAFQVARAMPRTRSTPQLPGHEGLRKNFALSSPAVLFSLPRIEP